MGPRLHVGYCVLHGSHSPAESPRYLPQTTHCNRTAARHPVRAATATVTKGRQCL